MALIIRDYSAEDADAVAALLHEVLPYLVTTPPGVHAQVTAAPARQRYRALLAEEDGRLVGCARVGLFADSSDAGLGFANLNVVRSARGRGVGSALLAAAEAHLASIGARTAYCYAEDAPAAHRFAARYGYRRGRSSRFLRLDLGAELPAVPEPAAGTGTVRLLPAAHWTDDPRPLYEADLESFQDEPSDVASDSLSYEDWRRITWDRPEFDAALTTVAEVDGQVAALVIAHTDGGARYFSAGTGTRRAFRGRGLAKAAKAHSLHLARAAGYRTAFTGNDDGNAPMLAVNRWLGYRTCATEVRYFRDLADGDTADRDSTDGDSTGTAGSEPAVTASD
ncbi:GNAT family N-acetyltransferase [Streptomyces sp. V4-01]|uniref:GNAT family N-acetyltransferase n=1 Tax=Actinacidiphila polyblastidii TaxID=3110430 RepID=A0ABU7PJL6_9ACTN|nr:GNAT family N-acetyltransferase [Streptomyces sp. V4-01]